MVPMELFGKDHWSTLLFIEHVIVDESGKLKDSDRRMRVWKYGEDKNYPTRLNDGTEVEKHDDWDCLYDLIEAGIVEHHDDGKLNLTDRGWKIAGKLRRWKSEGKGIANFKSYEVNAPAPFIRYAVIRLIDRTWIVEVPASKCEHRSPMTPRSMFSNCDHFYKSLTGEYFPVFTTLKAAQVYIRLLDQMRLNEENHYRFGDPFSILRRAEAKAKGNDPFAIADAVRKALSHE